MFEGKNFGFRISDFGFTFGELRFASARILDFRFWIGF